MRVEERGEGRSDAGVEFNCSNKLILCSYLIQRREKGRSVLFTSSSQVLIFILQKKMIPLTVDWLVVEE